MLSGGAELVNKDCDKQDSLTLGSEGAKGAAAGKPPKCSDVLSSRWDAAGPCSVSDTCCVRAGSVLSAALCCFLAMPRCCFHSSRPNCSRLLWPFSFPVSLM